MEIWDVYVSIDSRSMFYIYDFHLILHILHTFHSSTSIIHSNRQVLQLAPLRLLGAVQHADALGGGRQRGHEAVAIPGAEETHLEHAHLPTQGPDLPICRGLQQFRY